MENIDFVDTKEVTLQKTLENAYCSVTYSSGSAIDSILFGIPTISTDPGNFAFDISSHYPEEIDSLYMPGDVEIKRWLLKLAYSQWSVSEMKEGIAWAHLCPIIENIQHERNLPEDDKKKKK